MDNGFEVFFKRLELVPSFNKYEISDKNQDFLQATPEKLEDQEYPQLNRCQLFLLRRPYTKDRCSPCHIQHTLL